MVAVTCAAVIGVVSSPASAYWSAAGAGAGQATTAQLVAPTVTTSVAAYSTDVDVTWTPGSAPAGLSRDGFYVIRTSGASTTPACGSTPSALLPADATSCTDAPVPDGAYTYSVIAAYRSWTATGQAAPVTVAADHVAPTVTLADTDATNTHLAERSGAYRVFFRPASGGSLAISAAVTDNQTGPASVAFPNPAAAGWTHANETATSGSGTPPTVTYTSTAFTYTPSPATPATITVLAADVAHNTTSVPVTFQADSTAPTGGGVTVNGVASTGGGSTSTNTTGAFNITVLTPYAEASTTTASGLATSELVRQMAPLTANTCGAFGGPAVISAPVPIAQTALADGCYRYTLTATDNVGNAATTSTTVKVDATAADGAALTVNATAAAGSGTTSTNRAGAFAITRTDFTDAQSGMGTSVLTRTSAPLGAGLCGAFGSASILPGAPAQSGLTTNCFRYVLTGTNAYGLVATLTTTVLVDTIAPTGGALVVNGVTATTAGSVSTNTSGTVNVTTLTGYTDANSGMSGTVLTRTPAPVAASVCGTFDTGATVTVTGPAPVPDGELAPGCYRYTLTGTDNAGNTASVSTTVRVDTTAPTSGAMSANSVDATTTGSTSVATSGAWSLTRSDFADPETTMTVRTLVRTQATFSAGICATTWTGSTTIPTTTTTQSGLSTRCYRYILTGTNSLGLSSTLQTIVRLDTTVPTGGALNVNGINASTAGSTSNNGTGSYSIATATPYTDTNSGMSSSAVVRTTAPLTGGTCGAFDPNSAVTIAGPLPILQSDLETACYRYILTGTNTVGGTASLTTTVRVDTTAPVDGALTVNSTDADVIATTSTAVAAGWTIGRTDFTDPDSTMIAQTLTRASATLSGGNCGSFGSPTTLTAAPDQTGLATACYRYVLTGTNSSGLTRTLTTIVKLDSVAPISGALTVNGGVASAAGTSTTSTTGTFSITTRADYTDPQSGIASSTLIRTTATTASGVCGTFDPDSALLINGPASIPQTTLPIGCYRYTLTGTNTYGGTASIITTVLVDGTAPTGGALTINGVAATAGSGSTSASPTAGWGIARTDFTDPDSAMTVQTLVRTQATITTTGCSTTFGTLVTIPASTTTETGLATNCYRYVLTGTNSLGLSNTLTTTVRLDTTPPTGGALTVNGVAANGPGTNSSSASGTFNVSVMTAMADTHSGMTGTVLTRTQAPVVAGVCGAFDSGTTTTVTGTLPIAQTTLAPGCYQFVLTGTNTVGGTSTLTTTVRVGS